MEEEFNTSDKFNRFSFQAKMENRIRSTSVTDADQNILLKPIKTTISLTFGNEIYDNLEKLRRLATVTGSFLPREMLAAAELTENFNILSQFSCDCNIQTGETIEWILKSEIRSVTYKSLQQEGKLLEHVNLAPAFRDEFGRLLFQFLLNAKEIVPGKMLSSELLELSNVLSSIGEIEGNIGQKVKQILQSRSILDDYYQVPENFIGRENELKTLANFVENKNYRGRWSGYLVHGQGGSGKSTLLAKFCRKVIDENSALMCVLDFDRPGINADDDIWMLNEFARQITTQSASDIMIPDKLKIIEESENYGGQASGHLPEYRSMRSQSLPNITQIKDIISEQAQRPIVVVLDTIEQVLLHQSWVSLQIWLDRLYDILSPTPVKVILSGRIYESIVSNNIEVRVDLADFDRKTAIEFLSRHGISRVDILKLLKYDLIPLRPLELRLIARILNQGQLNLEELIDDIQNGNGGNLCGEYFIGSVYRR
ncbi:MAG: ATP-binding protein, partial [Pedobacter sp.]